MKRLAILLAWDNFSEYHSQQLAIAIADEWDTTITYNILDWDEFDLVMPFFPHRQVDAKREKVIKLLWEPQEFGYGAEAGTVIASSSMVYDRLKESSHRFPRLIHLPWGINSIDFAPSLFPFVPPLKVGWCGLPMLERKQYDKLKETIEGIPGIEFLPNLTETTSGRTHGPYEMQDMGRYYAQIHIYACASIWEGFGFPILEASACGRPVVTFDVGCARDLKQSGAGIVIVDSFKEMKEAITTVDYHALGEQSAEAVRLHWAWDKMSPRWLEMLNDTYQYSIS